MLKNIHKEVEVPSDTMVLGPVARLHRVADRTNLTIELLLPLFEGAPQWLFDFRRLVHKINADIEAGVEFPNRAGTPMAIASMPPEEAIHVITDILTTQVHTCLQFVQEIKFVPVEEQEH